MHGHMNVKFHMHIRVKGHCKALFTTGREQDAFIRHVKVKQSRYRPGVAQRVPES
jgi:hypothetical protein